MDIFRTKDKSKLPDYDVTQDFRYKSAVVAENLGVCCGGLSYKYEYKSMIIYARWSGLLVYGVHIVIGNNKVFEYSKDIYPNGSWKYDMVDEPCIKKIINIVDKLYDEAITKIETDKIDARSEVRKLCKEL